MEKKKKEAPFYTQYTQERKHEGLLVSLEGRGREETLIYVLLNFEAVCSSSYLEFITLLSYSCGIILYDLKIRFTQIKKSSFTLPFTFCGPGNLVDILKEYQPYRQA